MEQRSKISENNIQNLIGSQEKMNSEEIENPICEECGFTASPDEFDASISAYHDLKCPRCGTTNIDWDYGGYKHNNLDMSRYV